METVRAHVYMEGRVQGFSIVTGQENREKFGFNRMGKKP